MASIEGKGFEGLLPPHVVFRQATFDLLDAVLFPEEAEGLVGVGAIRQAEFAHLPGAIARSPGGDGLTQSRDPERGRRGTNLASRIYWLNHALPWISGDSDWVRTGCRPDRYRCGTRDYARCPHCSASRGNRSRYLAIIDRRARLRSRLQRQGVCIQSNFPVGEVRYAARAHTYCG